VNEDANFKIKHLKMDSLEAPIKNLERVGKIQIGNNGYAYVDINDDYIHQVYTLIESPSTVKPNYFDEETNFIGAHISFIYQEKTPKFGRPIQIKKLNSKW
jgi:hypothetical protein